MKSTISYLMKPALYRVTLHFHPFTYENLQIRSDTFLRRWQLSLRSKEKASALLLFALVLNQSLRLEQR
jgi:hypothetical protein